MQKSILEYLEHTVKVFPEKIAFADDFEELSFRQVYENARAIGTFFGVKGFTKEPIVVFMGKHPGTITAFLGVIYAGCHYIPIDEEMPKQRIELILKSLKSVTVLCDKETFPISEEYGFSGNIYIYEDIIKTAADDNILRRIEDKQIDTDPVYVVYTSGSTGIPKGVAACHRSVIDYLDNLAEAIGFDSETVFGNQAPLYLDGCLKDVFSVIKTGATAYLIPKKLFMFPIKLAEYLNENRINTICWVASALTVLSTFKVFEKVLPKYLKTITFGGEFFPPKHLQIFRKYLPEVRYFNLYGPTEATGFSCYYEIKRDFEHDEVIPVGIPFRNTEIILLDENKKVPEPGQLGEICIRGTALTLGYYGNFDKTGEVFIQNPLNDLYPELIYRTGDLGRYNENGELLFISRRDNQIKHMGYRIELGEIELAASTADSAGSVCCIFDEHSKKLVLYYTGEASKNYIISVIKEKLPRYMIPNVVLHLESLPVTLSGKVDRKELREKYIRETGRK
ncbi:MAG: amino acid adenylation domain-containing protein [Eubacteriales bacterium]|nr:amino acid adenylation domain-containing protein [Eubacteriales bacterium]MDD4421777.1 amino acid adenylation domain-containing protein [Eubacteriales bacterium]